MLFRSGVRLTTGRLGDRFFRAFKSASKICLTKVAIWIKYKQNHYILTKEVYYDRDNSDK